MGVTMNRKSLYILLVLQALIILLLCLAQGLTRTITLVVFGIVDLAILITLLMRKWSFAEFFAFTAFFSSLLFSAFFLPMAGLLTIVLGVAVMILFLVAAWLDYIENVKFQQAVSEVEGAKPLLRVYDHEEYPELRPVQSPSVQPSPQKPADSSSLTEARTITPQTEQPGLEEYDVHELERQATELEKIDQQIRDFQNAMKKIEEEKKREKKSTSAVSMPLQITPLQVRPAAKPRAAPHAAKKSISHAPRQDAQKARAQAVAYELEREARALKKAQEDIVKVQNRAKVKRVAREAEALQRAQRDINQIKAATKTMQVLREANALKNAQRDINHVQERGTTTKILREAAVLAQAQKSITAAKAASAKKKQNALTREAHELVRLQKSIDTLAKAKPKTKTVRVVSPAPKESFFVATDTGTNFHEPGCMTIKHVKKNKLTLFTSRKDALKHGYHPCNVCKP